jgi:acetyl-CoA decarbonylase/synthase complex subunit gamma
MALSGIQIFKQLPKTNCKDCGYATCMAFALQVASGKASIEACPHLSSDVAAGLAAVTAPPVARVEFGPKDRPIVLGEETVLYRHEKRFEHPPALAVLMDDSLDDRAFELALDEFNGLQFERVGEILRPQLIAVASADPSRLAARVKAVSERTQAGLVIMADDPEVLRLAASPVKEVRPLLCGATLGTLESVARGRDMDELAEIGRRCLELGATQMILEPVAFTAGDALAAQVFTRRAAIRDRVKNLGFPTMALPCRLASDPLVETTVAAGLIAKYAGVIVVDHLDSAHISALLTLAQGLYTDPQKPMMVDPGIYPVGGPGPDSPVLLTTNFSLTYYTVVGEIENSKVPAWLLVMDVEGQSVLTAWAAGKFVADAIAPFVQKSGIEQQVEHRRLIIPGYVASMREELEAELGGWEIAVGVREAADLSRYLRKLAEAKA